MARLRPPRIRADQDHRRSLQQTQAHRRSRAARKPEVAWEVVLIRKLFQKSEVVFVEQANVSNLVAKHGDALDTDAPRKPRVSFGVVANGFEDRRVHHAAPAEFDPARLLAHRATGAFTLPAAQV